MTAPARDLRAVPGVDPDASGPLRKTALVLHAMSEEDRGWLLGQLTDDERKALRVLLAELRELGIPADRALLEDALRMDAPHATPPVPEMAQPPSNVEVLRRADPRRLVAILRDEPACLIAALLRVSEWPWRGDLLRGFDASVRRQVQEALLEERVPGGELLQEHLIAALTRRLGGEASRRRRGLARLLPFIRGRGP